MNSVFRYTCNFDGNTVHLLIIDNYDSFTYNLVHLFSREGLEISVIRNDAASVAEICTMHPDLLCLSPGPGTPQDSGICKDLIHALMDDLPIFGVCLGMQTINEVFGGSTVGAPRPVHGKTSPVLHSGNGILRNVPLPFPAARYHSLCLGDVSPQLRVNARSDDGVVMAVEHTSLPIFGVQFHPESFMSEHGALIADNVLRIAQIRLNRGTGQRGRAR